MPRSRAAACAATRPSGFAGGVNHIPLAVDLTGFGHISGHSVYLKIDLNYLGTGKRFVRCDTKSLKMPIAFPWALNDSTTRKRLVKRFFAVFKLQILISFILCFLVYTLIFKGVISKKYFLRQNLKSTAFPPFFGKAVLFTVFIQLLLFHTARCHKAGHAPCSCRKPPPFVSS